MNNSGPTFVPIILSVVLGIVLTYAIQRFKEYRISVRRRRRNRYRSLCFIKKIDVSKQRRNKNVYERLLHTYLLRGGYNEIMNHKSYLMSNRSRVVNNRDIVRFVYIRKLHDCVTVDLEQCYSFREVEQLYRELTNTAPTQSSTIRNKVRVEDVKFEYPYFEHAFDISGRRGSNNIYQDMIELYLMTGGYELIMEHKDLVIEWKNKCSTIIRDGGSSCDKMRKQFRNVVDDDNVIKFYFVRRYTGRNDVIDRIIKLNFEHIEQLYKDISKNGVMQAKARIDAERRKLTSSLREQVMRRDNYTCQICGKYMPDTVGLQIDHIIPVSKGGKTELDNLRCLCSLCNGRKSNKVNYNPVDAAVVNYFQK